MQRETTPSMRFAVWSGHCGAQTQHRVCFSLILRVCVCVLETVFLQVSFICDLGGSSGRACWHAIGKHSVLPVAIVSRPCAPPTSRPAHRNMAEPRASESCEAFSQIMLACCLRLPLCMYA